MLRRDDDKIIVSKKLRPTTFFHDLLECLLVDEGNGAGRYISGLCFPMGPPYTGRPPRGQGGGGGADELGQQETGTVAGPQGALLSQQRDGRKR